MDRAEALGITPLAEVVSHGQVAGPDASLLHQPSNAIGVALDRAGLTVADMDLLEINEAFAAVGLASIAELGISDEIVNVNGGAIALGHPIGASGTRGSRAASQITRTSRLMRLAHPRQSNRTHPPRRSWTPQSRSNR